jgi:hypothetical protein
MAKKHCKKSSMQAVADEVKVRAGYPSSATIPGNYIETTIRQLDLPVQKGAPNITLTANNTYYDVEGGKYTGGSVSVVPQRATAALSQNGGYVQIESGKTLASVKVPAKNAYSYSSGKITPSDKATSISITGLSFEPTHIAIMNTSIGSIYDNAVVSFYCAKQESIMGLFTAKSGYLGKVSNATVSFGTNSVTISNIVGIRNEVTINGIFRNKEYCWFAWG